LVLRQIIIEFCRHQVITFTDKPYLLEPNWFSGERYRSKRFVSLALLPQRSMLDLVLPWRSACRDIPRAKLCANRGRIGEEKSMLKRRAERCNLLATYVLYK